MTNDLRRTKLARLSLVVAATLTLTWETVNGTKTTDQVVMAAAQVEKVDAVTRWLAEGAQLETTDHQGKTALEAAIQSGHTDVVKMLLLAGANVNAGAGNRTSALHVAAASGKTDIVNALLDAGARVDVVDQDGNAPLHIAVANPTNKEIVKALLDAGARVDAANHEGMQPLHLAARSAGVGTVQTLLASGAKADAVDVHGLRPLHLVALGGARRMNAVRASAAGAQNLRKLLYALEYLTVVKVLLSNGASFDVKDKNGKRPIDYAAEGGFTEMVDVLLAAGAKPPR
jgi:ankyrin repeat protein